MSAPSNITTDLAASDIQFYDSYIPALTAGSYFITVAHTLAQGDTTVNGTALSAQQEFVVAAPQFSLDSSQIISQYPPAGSTGQYGEVLPHIVLKDPMLAWERTADPTATASGTPWLALLVLEDTELLPGTNPATQTTTTTVAGYRGLPSTVLVARPALEADVDPTSSCQYITLPTTVFQAIVPRLDELLYLSHIRKINTGARPLMGLNEHGLFSVTAANRFASPAGATAAAPVKNIAHLVSLEGLSDYLAADADLSAYSDGVALLSLASWSFLVQPDQARDFKTLATNLVKQETTAAGAIDPARLWLRLAAPAAGSGTAAEVAVAGRLASGYAPLAYHTRSGENTFAWYRGPLAPLLPQAQPQLGPFYTADAALIYDTTYGVFDASLAAAWEAGRAAALADAYFGQRLLALRKKAHGLVDALYYRLASDQFTAAQVDQVDVGATVQAAFLALLTPQLIQDLGATASTSSPASSAAAPAPSTTDPVADAKDFLADPAVQAQLLQLVADDLAPLAEWLGRLLLLYPLPFANLVPDERLLPVESLRFFYLDANWLTAALDGALSLGLDSSLQKAFSEAARTVLHQAAWQAVAVLRDKLQGQPTDPNPVAPTVISGFLLRSALVSGWPTLAVRAQDSTDTSLKLLRLDHLGPGLLFGLFDGVPQNIEFSEPPEGLGFGVDDTGCAVLRRVVAGTSPDAGATQGIGTQLTPVQIRDMQAQQPFCMRSATSRVLHVAPGDSAGLIQTLAAALKKQGGMASGQVLSPATLAMQLLKSAEAVVFYSQPA